METSAELMLDAKAILGEGALWHARSRTLYWVDILANQLHLYDPAAGRDRAVDAGQPVGTVVARRAGGVMLGVHHGFARFDPETARLEIVADPEKHLPNNRFNDGKCDPAGRFWAGTMAFDAARGAGSLYCLEPDLRVRRMLGDVSCSNGIVWTKDGRTMYYIDTFTSAVSAFDYDLETGDIRNRRDAIRIPEADGYPDGMTIDAEDRLWIAHWGGGRVTQWDPKTGRLLRTIRLPVSKVTSCSFGGPDLGTLYITSARTSLTPEALAKEPLAGGLFQCQPGVRGVELAEFAG